MLCFLVLSPSLFLNKILPDHVWLSSSEKLILPLADIGQVHDGNGVSQLKERKKGFQKNEGGWIRSTQTSTGSGVSLEK